MITLTSASTFAQRIQLNARNQHIKTVLQQIEEQSGYSFIYDSKILANGRSINLDLDAENIDKALAKLATQLNVDYSIVNKTVTLTKAKATQENITVAGKVLLKESEGVAPYPQAGVNILVKGSGKVITTNAQGEFSLTVAANSILEISFIGYEKIEMRASDLQKNTTVILENSTNMLDEVVTTGYQRLNKRELASSIFSIKAEDVVVTGALSIDQMLQGKVPGMSVQLTSGEPSAASKIRIRGTSTINGNKAPIWVIDGVIQESSMPFNASDVNSPDAAYLIGSNVAGLNPQDIASIDVLKDASATAIYGVKAANGVIVITTKNGMVGKPKITFNTGLTVNQRPSYSRLNRMNSQERIQLSKEITDAGLRFMNSPKDVGYEGLLQQLYNKELTQEEFVLRAKDLEVMNTDWYDLLFRNSIYQDYTVGLSGANDRTDYYVSLGYNDSKGSALGSNSDRLTGMLKLGTEVSDNLRISFKFNGSKSKNLGFNKVNPNDYAYSTSRALSPYDANGGLSYYNLGTSGRPLAFNVFNELNETGSIGDVQAFGLQTNVDWKIKKYLRFKSLVAYDMSGAKTRNYATERSYYIAGIRGYDLGAVEPFSKDELDSKLPYGGEYAVSNNTSANLTLRNTLDFNMTFAEKHNVNLFGGQEIRVNKANGNSFVGYGYDNEGGERLTTPTLTADFLSKIYGITLPKISEKEARFSSWFMTGSYAYDSRYIFNGNIRWDGANKLGTNPKYRYLPVWSLAGKWIISNERFLADNDILSFLALRSSYGIQGNIHDDSSPELIMRYAGRDDISKLKYSNVYRLPNPDLRWEKTKSINAALEFGLLQGRLSGTFEYYNKRGVDLIISKQVSQATGRSYVRINSGVMENKGIEGSVSLDLIKKKDWNWNVTMNAARNINTILESQIPEAETDQIVQEMLSGNITTAGTSVGTFYSYQMTGLSPENGYPLFMDKNGDKVFKIDPKSAELVKSGNFNPDVVGGFDSRVSYKGFQATVGLSFALGGYDRLPALYRQILSVFNPIENVTTEVNNRWKQPGDEANTNIPALFDDRTAMSFQRYYDQSDVRVAKTDFLRLRNLSVGYQVPSEWLKRYRVQGLMLRLQANNLRTWTTKEWHNLDPESPTANIPVLPSYSFTLNLTF
ncbi:hypothetical protein M472_08660 [Sphingobacterium paucimobilis HER1398]|uniref:Secretin/TonB short N-terminal domain-containing protein n=2 Tax=Sphingobacterium TaxID=28453 RepID=U2J1I9_9SPHI|nr:hypothetical protein M472_08660 [Sphingobacterium paucimobilis HER1398]